MLPASSYLRYCGLLPGAEPADCMPALWSARSRKSEWELDAHPPRLRADEGRHGVRARSCSCPAASRSTSSASSGTTCGCTGTRARSASAVSTASSSTGRCWRARAGPCRARRRRRCTGPACRRRRAAARRGARCATGDAVVIDISGLAEGYVSDQTRTFFIGHADPALLAAYETCRRILAECVALLVPGTPGSALYERALEVATEAGYAEQLHGRGRRARALRRPLHRARAQRAALPRARLRAAARGRQRRRDRAQARVHGPRRGRRREHLLPRRRRAPCSSRARARKR